MAEPWDDLFAEAGLPAEEYRGVGSALAELREAPLPALEPSEQLAALLAGGTLPSRRRAGWLPAVAALVAVTGGGVSAAAAFGTLPDPVQEFMHEVSDTLLPFEFPEPEPETPDDGVPGVPSGTPGAPPDLVPGQGIRPLPAGGPTFPPGATPSGRPAAVPLGTGDLPGGAGPGTDALQSIAPGGVPPLPSHHVPTKAPGAPSGIPSVAPTTPAAVEHADHPAADQVVDTLEQPQPQPQPTRSPGQQGSHGPTRAP